MQGGGGGEEQLSMDELGSNLSTYRDQLHQIGCTVVELLVDDPQDSEFLDMKKELEQVIALTEELLATAEQNEISGSNNEAGFNQSSSHSKEVYAF